MRRSRIAALLAATLLAAAVVVPASATTPADGRSASVALTSAPGDYIGQGQDLVFTTPDATIDAYYTPNWQITVWAQVPGHSFGMQFEAIDLGVGLYENARRGGLSWGYPGIDAFGDGRGCNMAYGWFRIDALTVDPTTNAITALDLAFEQHCESILSPALTGSVHVITNSLPEGFHEGSPVSVAAADECYAAGWAFDPDEGNAPVAVRVFADDQQVWLGSADQFRQDLLDAGIGNGYHFFYVSLVGLVTPDVVHVIRAQAQDVNSLEWVDLQLTPRTITCLDSQPAGWDEGITGPSHSFCEAAGWAIDPDVPAGRVPIRVSSDGIVIWEGIADQYRQDLLDAGIGDGFHAFSKDLHPLISSDVPHLICMQAQDLDNGEWVDLSGTPRSMTCTEIFGTHDGFQGVASKAECRATGWAADLDTATGPRVQVRINVDGRVVVETTANQFREDVLAAGFGDGYSGFDVNLYGKVIPDRAHVVTVEARDTTAKKIWVPLDGTPVQLTCSSH